MSSKDPCVEGLVLLSVGSLGNGVIFKRWGLVESAHVIWYMTLKGIVGPCPAFLFYFQP